MFFFAKFRWSAVQMYRIYHKQSKPESGSKIGSEIKAKARSKSRSGKKNTSRFTTLYTVDAKNITCAKSITRYDNNGHNISKFFLFFFFSFFLFPTECKNNNFNIKSEFFLWEYVMTDTKNNFFLPPFFSAADFFATGQLSRLPICYWRELTYPKLPVLF